jgi:hypothetical protein
MQYIILGGDNLIFSYFFPRNKCEPPQFSYEMLISYSQKTLNY